ncbi:dCTP deaminase domain-containing protein [Flavobacterium sp. N1736]|uniref:dCTP deaminase domain-containing protein n=1 Tax=Flavobacterium sp. N1736 TaxID=2986823 RepID=UPI00222568C9|nr:hypothetical protein [Flavobacterium sp. N1736]
MAFVGNKKLIKILEATDVIVPYKEANIKNAAYELSLGNQVFQTDSKPRTVKTLSKDEKIYISPGQFALLLTEETVKVPQDKIAFISIKAGIKFKGLVNVSGFHVDPGFEGKLLFSVYNAGPAVIILSSGEKYFPIWFADISKTDDYKGKHEHQEKIPNEPVEALSQNELASPNVLSSRIDTLKDHLTKIEWVGLAILTLVIGINVKFWTDHNNMEKAVEFGYNNKAIEISSDSMYKKMESKIIDLNVKIDSLNKTIKRLKNP